MPNENTQTNHKDQADGKFDKNYSMSSADAEVRENEDASLQDDSYSFDEDNTDNEEFHDMDDLGEEAGDLTDIFESDDDLQ